MRGDAMQIPPQEEWLTVKQAAKMFGVSEQVIYRAHRTGRKNVSGDVVKLEFFRTLSGMMTTRERIDRFLSRLNG